MLEDVTDASRLVSFGFQPGMSPPKLAEYRDLTGRYLSDAGFAQVVHAAALGFGCEVVTVDPKAGIVLEPVPKSPFVVSVAEHVPNPKDRPLVLLAHLAIAALAFPRAGDLDDTSHVGRISVAQVDETVTDAAESLNRAAAEAGEDEDPPADQPELVTLWRYWLRRNSVGRTGDSRALWTSRRALIKRAAEYLADNGMLRRTSEGETYTTTVRYQIHVREMAGTRLLGELAELGIAVPGGGGLTTADRPDPSQLPA